jgi:hypothetical protein
MDIVLILKRKQVSTNDLWWKQMQIDLQCRYIFLNKNDLNLHIWSSVRPAPDSTQKWIMMWMSVCRHSDAVSKLIDPEYFMCVFQLVSLFCLLDFGYLLLYPLTVQVWFMMWGGLLTCKCPSRVYSVLSCAWLICLSERKLEEHKLKNWHESCIKMLQYSHFLNYYADVGYRQSVNFRHCV